MNRGAPAFAAVAFAFVVAEVACGARTSLLVGSVTADAAPFRWREGGTTGGCYTALPLGETDPVYFQFVVDGSGSMKSDRKWDATEQALDQVFDDFLGGPSTRASVALIVFSDRNDPTFGRGPYPSKVDISLGSFDRSLHNKLRNRLDTTEPLRDTPTHIALKGAFDALEKFARTPVPPAERGGKKTVILLTDGVPDAPPEEIIALAREYEMKETRLFVFGIGKSDSAPSEYDPDFLSQLAIAGGTRRSPSCGSVDGNYCHYQIDPRAVNTSSDLATALNDARLRSSNVCEYAVVGEGTLLQDATEVIFDDGAGGFSTIEQDEIDGWTFDNAEKPSRIIVRGKACAMIQSNKRGGLSIRLSCEKD